jgi:hypothetical protein
MQFPRRALSSVNVAPTSVIMRRHVDILYSGIQNYEVWMTSVGVTFIRRFVKVRPVVQNVQWDIQTAASR